MEESSVAQAAHNAHEQFADTRKDEDLNTIYRLNQCEFKVMPHFSFEKDK